MFDKYLLNRHLHGTTYSFPLVLEYLPFARGHSPEELGDGEEVVGAGDEGVGVVGRRRGLGSAVGRGGREGG